MSPSMWTWRVILPGLGIVAGSLVLWQTWKPVEETRESTPNKTNPTAARVIAEGRIVARPGAEIEVRSELGGLVLAMPVLEKSKVKKGDLLVEFRSEDARLALAEAEARLAEGDADLSFAQAELTRKVQIKPTTPATERENEAARHEVQVAVARRKAADLAVARARLAVTRTKILAPIEGVIMTADIHPGEVAAPGSRLVTICDLSRLRVEAEVDEFDVARIHERDAVVIKAEGYETTWKGTVEEIPDRVASRTLQPDDPGRPSDTKVLLVKIAVETPLPLKLGQQVNVEIRPEPAIDTHQEIHGNLK